MTLRIIIIIIIVLIAAVLIFAATKPNTLRVQRSMLINASPGKSSRSSTTSTIGGIGRLRTKKTPP
jgi:hypothetical protein